MNKLKKILISSLVFCVISAHAFDFRIGPKVGLGIGTISGISDADTKIALAPVIGVLTQFDFGSVGVDIGANYRYNVFGFGKEYDLDNSGSKETEITYVLGYSSLEIPATAYYKLNVGRGFFKFGGGAGLDLGFGKVKRSVEVEVGSLSGDEDDTVSFNEAGIKQVDLYLIGHFGYELDFESWALSIDLQPKYGLVDKAKDDDEGPAKWHTLWVDLGVGFLF